MDRDRFVPLKDVPMAVVDHHGFLPYVANHLGQIKISEFQGIAAAVAPGQEQKLLDQALHMIRLVFDGLDGLVENLRIFLSPPVQHIDIALDHRNRRPQLVGSVRDEPLLLQPALPHPVKHIVDGDLQALQILVAGGHVGVRAVRVQPADSLLHILHLAAVKRLAGQLLRPQRHVRDRPHQLADLSRAKEAGYQDHGLGDQQYGRGHFQQREQILEVISVLSAVFGLYDIPQGLKGRSRKISVRDLLSLGHHALSPQEKSGKNRDQEHEIDQEKVRKLPQPELHIDPPGDGRHFAAIFVSFHLTIPF